MGKIIRESGVRANVIKDFDYVVPKDKFGNKVPQAVAMVMACVAFYRLRMLPIKTVYLREIFFIQFKDWVRQHVTEQQADEMETANAPLTFDGVFVEQGSKLSEKDLYYDFYPQQVND